MRKFTLLAALIAISFSAFSQNYFIEYDAQCMDKFEYKFVHTEANNMPYTVYRLNKNEYEKLYFETGVESVVIKKEVPGTLIACNQTNIDKVDVNDINKGIVKIFICKRLDSGWAILPVATASYMYYANNYLTFQGPDYDLKVDFTQSFSNNNLSDNNQSAMSSIFFAGQIDACQQKATSFNKISKDVLQGSSIVTILPSVGLIQDKSSNGQNFELVSINGMFVCDYLKKGDAPTMLMNGEPKPEAIPVQYSTVGLKSNVKVFTDAFGEEKMYERGVVSESNNAESIQQAAAPVNCELLAKTGEHVVGEGESLYGIARRYGLTVNSIRSWNELTTDNIFPCTIIKIIAPPIAEQPSMTTARVNDVPMSYDLAVIPEKLVSQSESKSVTTPKSICDVEVKEGEHVIQRGESLYAIARKYNIKIDQLRTWNDLKSDKIEPCDILKVSAPTVQSKSAENIPQQYSTVVKPKGAKTSKTVVATNKKNINTKKGKQKTEEIAYVKKESCLHIVKKGETLSGIAKEWKLSIANLRQYNNLGKKDNIMAGQVLRMQSKPCFVEDELPENYGIIAKPKSAVVKKDEIVPKDYTVVVKPKSEKNKAKEAKSMAQKEDIPHSYNTVVLPKPIKVMENDEPVVTTKSIENKTRKYHIVQVDETLTSVANKYGLSVEKLRELNKLESNELILPNQLLVLE